MLAHNEVQRCFINPQPDEDYNEPGFRVKRQEKTIGSGRYEVIDVYENDQFWEAIYLRAATNTPLLSVYSEGRCRSEAERILEAHEKTRADKAEK
jgi:hypothetical protein